MNPDTEPAPPSSETPTLLRFFTELPKRTQYLLALLFVVAVLGAAYFIGAANYYRVEPLPIELPDLVDGANQDRNSNFFLLSGTEQESFRARLHSSEIKECPEESSDSSYSYIEENDVTITHNWYGNPEEVKVCNYIKTNGTRAIGHPISLGATRGPAYSNGSDMPVNVGTIKIGTTVHLLQFHMYPQPDERTYVSISSSVLKDTHSVTNLEFIFAGKTALLKIEGLSLSGAPFERYLILNFSIHGSWLGQPANKLPDGTFEQRIKFIPRSNDVYHRGIPSISFAVPLFSRTSGPSTGDRYSMFPSDPNLDYYHSAQGELEETYANAEFQSRLSESNMNISVKINTGQDALLRITSSLFGYASEDWGKVLKTITYESFKEMIRAPVAHRSNAPVRTTTLSGYTVKVIGPLKNTWNDRGENHAMYQYQTVRGNAVVSATFTMYSESNAIEAPPLPQAEAEAYLARLLETLVITP